MITCEQVNELLTDYLDKRISLPRRLAIKLHFWMCNNCSRNARQFKKTIQMMSHLPKEAAPADLLARLEGSFDNFSPCPICNQEVRYLELHLKAEEQIIDIIQKDHPEWIEDSGICTQCIEYYRQELARHGKIN